MLTDLMNMWSRNFNFTWDIYADVDGDWGLFPISGMYLPKLMRFSCKYTLCIPFARITSFTAEIPFQCRFCKLELIFVSIQIYLQDISLSLRIQYTYLISYSLVILKKILVQWRKVYRMNPNRFKVHFRFLGPYNASGEWKGVMGDVVMGR